MNISLSEVMTLQSLQYSVSTKLVKCETQSRFPANPIHFISTLDFMSSLFCYVY